MSFSQSIRHFLFTQDSWLWRPNRRLLYWITTAVFVCAIAATVFDTLDLHPRYWARFQVSKEKREFESSFSNESRVYTVANGSLMQGNLRNLPPAQRPLKNRASFLRRVKNGFVRCLCFPQIPRKPPG